MVIAWIGGSLRPAPAVTVLAAIVARRNKPVAIDCDVRAKTVSSRAAPRPGQGRVDFCRSEKPVIACNVVDISAGGACIEVHGADTIPTRFILNHGGVKRSCHVVWQKGRRVGVSF